MQKFRKRISAFLCLMFISLVILMFFPTKVYAWEAHLNENGDVEIYTVDKKKTSKIWYHSEGITITRCAYDPTSKTIHPSGDWYARVLDNPIIEVFEGMTDYATFTIPMQSIIDGASMIDSAWAQEIQDAIDGTGPAVYIKIDCVMFTQNDNNGTTQGPYVNVPGLYGGNGYLETGIRADGVQIRNAYGWANPNGLKTHFNHYLLIGKEDVPEIIPMTDDEFVTYDYTMDHYANIDANQPAFAMSNYSSQFDLSQGIPSSEYIDNNFLADSWYGNTNVYARIVGRGYAHNMTYIWQEDNGYWQDFDDDNDGIVDRTEWIEDWDTYSETHSIPIGGAYVAFQYLTDTRIYDFTNADVANGAYDGDHIYYDDDREVPMTCIATSEYEDVGTSIGALIRQEPDWRANTEDHVIFGEINYPTAYNFGRSAGRPNIETQIIHDRDTIRAQLSAMAQTRNDRLVIDGHTFMKNDWVRGCNFFDAAPITYRSCTRSSAWINDYCLQRGIRPLHEFNPADVVGSTTVQIPPTVDNGYYYTSMKVYYQRLVTYSKTLSEFEAQE